MPRRAGGNGREVFRVVIVRDNPRDGEITQTFGPYATIGAARAVLTTETHNPWGEPRTGVTGRIERATTDWKKVSE